MVVERAASWNQVALYLNETRLDPDAYARQGDIHQHTWAYSQVVAVDREGLGASEPACSKDVAESNAAFAVSSAADTETGAYLLAVHLAVRLFASVPLQIVHQKRALLHGGQ